MVHAVRTVLLALVAVALAALAGPGVPAGAGEAAPVFGPERGPDLVVVSSADVKGEVGPCG